MRPEPITYARCFDCGKMIEDDGDLCLDCKRKRLESAAPEMLEMLKQAHTFIGEACIDGESENCNILAEMFALINRAEGRG